MSFVLKKVVEEHVYQGMWPRDEKDGFIDVKKETRYDQYLFFFENFLKDIEKHYFSSPFLNFKHYIEYFSIDFKLANIVTTENEFIELIQKKDNQQISFLESLFLTINMDDPFMLAHINFIHFMEVVEQMKQFCKNDTTKNALMYSVHKSSLPDKIKIFTIQYLYNQTITLENVITYYEDRDNFYTLMLEDEE